eukprot:PhM_4_TR2684/c0_g1_i1/m.54088
MDAQDFSHDFDAKRLMAHLQSLRDGTASQNGRSSPTATETRALYCDVLRYYDAWYKRLVPITVASCTWNVGEANARSAGDMSAWLRLDERPDIVAYGLEEVDMRAQAFVMQGKRKDLWRAEFHNVLHMRGYVHVATVHLVGLLLEVYVAGQHAAHLRNLQTGMFATGTLGMGNKGGVGCRFTLYHRRFAFVVSHFAPHKENWNKRNTNYYQLLQGLKFPMPPNADDEIDMLLKSSWEPVDVDVAGPQGSLISTDTAVTEAPSLLCDHDYVFWMGDLNYRIIGEVPWVREQIQAKNYTNLMQHDQLTTSRNEMQVFNGFLEATVAFAPTYKYDVGSPVYDTSSKQRCPSWTDRVLYYQSRPLCLDPSLHNAVEPLSYDRFEYMLSDHRPVSGLYRVHAVEVDKEGFLRALRAAAHDLQPHIFGDLFAVPIMEATHALYRMKRPDREEELDHLFDREDTDAERVWASILKGLRTEFTDEVVIGPHKVPMMFPEAVKEVQHLESLGRRAVFLQELDEHRKLKAYEISARGELYHRVFAQDDSGTSALTIIGSVGNKIISPLMSPFVSSSRFANKGNYRSALASAAHRDNDGADSERDASSSSSFVSGVEYIDPLTRKWLGILPASAAMPVTSRAPVSAGLDGADGASSSTESAEAVDYESDDYYNEEGDDSAALTMDALQTNNSSGQRIRSGVDVALEKQDAMHMLMDGYEAVIDKIVGPERALYDPIASLSGSPQPRGHTAPHQHQQAQSEAGTETSSRRSRSAHPTPRNATNSSGRGPTPTNSSRNAMARAAHNYNNNYGVTATTTDDNNDDAAEASGDEDDGNDRLLDLIEGIGTRLPINLALFLISNLKVQSPAQNDKSEAEVEAAADEHHPKEWNEESVEGTEADKAPVTNQETSDAAVVHHQLRPNLVYLALVLVDAAQRTHSDKLYEMGREQYDRRQRALRDAMEARAKAELEGCTFKPQLSKNSMSQSRGGIEKMFENTQAWMKKKQVKLDEKRRRALRDFNEDHMQPWKMGGKSVKIVDHLKSAHMYGRNHYRARSAEISEHSPIRRRAALTRMLEEQAMFSPVINQRSTAMAALSPVSAEGEQQQEGPDMLSCTSNSVVQRLFVEDVQSRMRSEKERALAAQQKQKEKQYDERTGQELFRPNAPPTVVKDGQRVPITDLPKSERAAYAHLGYVPRAPGGDSQHREMDEVVRDMLERDKKSQKRMLAKIRSEKAAIDKTLKFMPKLNKRSLKMVGDGHVPVADVSTKTQPSASEPPKKDSGLEQAKRSPEATVLYDKKMKQFASNNMEWQAKRNRRLEKCRTSAEKEELKECTFAPKLSQATKEMIRSSSLGHAYLEAVDKKPQQQQQRQTYIASDDGTWRAVDASPDHYQPARHSVPARTPQRSGHNYDPAPRSPSNQIAPTVDWRRLRSLSPQFHEDNNSTSPNRFCKPLALSRAAGTVQSSSPNPPSYFEHTPPSYAGRNVWGPAERWSRSAPVADNNDSNPYYGMVSPTVDVARGIALTPQSRYSTNGSDAGAFTRGLSPKEFRSASEYAQALQDLVGGWEGLAHTLE